MSVGTHVLPSAQHEIVTKNIFPNAASNTLCVILPLETDFYNSITSQGKEGLRVEEGDTGNVSEIFC